MKKKVDIEAAVTELVAFFENITPNDVQHMGHYYDKAAHFRDPFNDAQDLDHIKRIFTHMFETLDSPRFMVLHTIAEGKRCALTWDFYFRLKSDKPSAAPRKIHGLTWLLFGSEGKIVEHIDYWDAAGQVYSAVPVLGFILRFVRNKLKVI